MGRDKEDVPVEDAPEAGMLEADVGVKFDEQLASIHPDLKLSVDALARRCLRAETMVIRDELKQAKRMILTIRQRELKALLLRDFIEEDKELRKKGFAYSPVYP